MQAMLVYEMRIILRWGVKFYEILLYKIHHMLLVKDDENQCIKKIQEKINLQRKENVASAKTQGMRETLVLIGKQDISLLKLYFIIACLNMNVQSNLVYKIIML